VVAIVGQQATASMGANYQQEVDLVALFKDVASEFVQVCMSPPQARHLIDRAVKSAAASRSVTCVIIPNDIQEAPFEEPPRAHGSVFSSPGFAPPRVLPRDEDLSRAADVLNAGEKVAMLIGQGAAGAADEVVQVAELLGAGVAKALNGRAALPDDLPFVTGSIGLLGTKPSADMIDGCDTFLMIGSSFPYSEWLPKEGQARGVQVDVNARYIGIRYPMEVGLVGDAKDTLQALIPLLQRKEDRSWLEGIEKNVERWWRVLAEEAQVPADPVNPQLVFHELGERLPDHCILTVDTGSVTDWWARHMKLRTGMQAALSGTLATMGPALPYAFAAKHEFPDRPVVAAVGDGGMQMLGINALIDVANRWREWSDPRLVVLVLNNRDLNQVTWEQRVLAGDAKLDASQVLPDFDYAGFAEMLGLRGIKVDTPDRVAPAWDEAMAADRPVVYEAVTDPEVPPLPPHIRKEQVKNMAKAMTSDPARAHIARETVGAKIKQFLTR
jgi:pyruvate dehydrogenase (quinone)